MRLKEHLENGGGELITEKKKETYTLDQINMALMKAGIGPKVVLQFMNALNVLRGMGIIESKVIGLLGKKIKKLKKEHGYISKSMFTKKELDQFQKSGINLDDFLERIHKDISY